jgi:hypothetical protein
MNCGATAGRLSVDRARSARRHTGELIDDAVRLDEVEGGDEPVAPAGDEAR